MEAEEKRQGARRLAILLSVVLYIACVLPVWWSTVRVPRAPMPHEQLQALEDVHGNFSFQLPVKITLYILCTDAQSCSSAVGDSGTAAVQRFKDRLQVQGVSSEVSITTELNGACTSSTGSSSAAKPSACLGLGAALQAQAGAGTAELDSFLQAELERRHLAEPGSYYLFLIPGSGPEAAVSAVVGAFRHAWLTYPSGRGANGIASALSHAADMAALSFAAGAGPDAAQSAAALPLSPRGEVRLSFSLCNAEPVTDAFTWRFGEFEGRYLAPLVRALQPVVRLSSQGQVLYYASARTHGAWSEKQHAWLLPSDQLRFFIDSSSWNLDSGRMAHATDWHSASTAEQDGSGAHGDDADAGAGSCDLVQDQSETTAQQQQQCRWQTGQAGKVPAVSSSAHLPPHVLSFVLYVPPAQYRPLRIAGDAADAHARPAAGRNGNRVDGANGDVSPCSFHLRSWGGLTIAGCLDGDADSDAAPAASASSDSTGSGSTDPDEQMQHQSASDGVNDHSGGGGADRGNGGVDHSAGDGVTAQQPSHQHISDAEMAAFAAVVVEQLHVLLGLDLHHRLLQLQHQATLPPHGHAATAAASHPEDGSSGGDGGGSGRRLGLRVVVLPALHEGFRRWEVDVLARLRASVSVTSAVRTLGSLSRLVQQLPNLAVPDDVAQHAQAAAAAVAAALASATAATTADLSGRGSSSRYHDAVIAAHAAAAHAEAAFSNPAISAKLNVPDTHYVGVYLPFFLPAAVPLLQGLLVEVGRLLAAARQRWRRRGGG